MSTAPHPGWLPASDLNDDELIAFQLAGRVDPTGEWLMPPPAEAAAAAAKAAAVKTEIVVPKPPPGVIERINAAKAVASSFVRTDEEGKVVAASDDGGAGAVAAAAPKPIENPDFAGKPKENPIDFADKERFLAHLLGGKPFTKTYHLFGGKLAVTFRTLSCSEQEQTGQQCWLDSNHETAMATDKRGQAEERVVRFAQYLFTAALYKIAAEKDVPQVLEPFKEKGNREAGILPIKIAHQKVQETFPWPIYRALMNAHGEFCELTNRLTNEAQNPSFWSPDAGT
jgi:hypothetical protein